MWEGEQPWSWTPTRRAGVLQVGSRNHTWADAATTLLFENSKRHRVVPRGLIMVVLVLV